MDMGAVWRAEQHEPVHRTMALKLIRAGMDSRGRREELYIEAPRAGRSTPFGVRRQLRAGEIGCGADAATIAIRRRSAVQQVTCRIALVCSNSRLSFSIASAVGTTTSLIFRRLASRFTSSMTGNAPVPVPITSRLHFQGISSSIDNGVCP